MPVTFTFPTSKISKEWEGKFKKVLPQFTEEVLKDCNNYCKEDTGALIASSYIHSVPAEGKMVWKTPYAARQFWEIETAHTDKNPNASWKWALVAKQNHMPEWMEKLRRLMNSDGLGGSK